MVNQNAYSPDFVGPPDPGHPPSERNFLDDFDVVTYKIQLYATSFIGLDLSDDAMVTSPPRPQYIIAETGVTDISIDNLTFESFYGFQAATYTSFSTVFNFQLKEALGSTLLDRVKYAAKRLGVDNFVKMPLFLKVSFVGRSKSSGDPLTVFKGRVWPIHIVDMKIQIDRGGSVYDCKAVRVGDYAHDNYLGTIRQPMNFEITDLPDALTKLQDYLKDPAYVTQSQANFANAAGTEVYKFNIHGDILKEGGGKFIEGSKSAWKSSRTDSFSELTLDKTTVMIDQGTSINRLIDILMANTQYLQKNIKRTQVDTMENQNKELALKDVYKIRADVKFTGYDTGTDDFTREITYYIDPFTIGTADAVTRPREKENPRSVREDYQGSWGTNGKVVKNYHYIYTGKNFHVLDFDIKINFAWFTALSPQYGMYGTTYHDTGTTAYTPKDQDPTSSVEAKAKADKANQGTKVSLKASSSPEKPVYLSRDHKDTAGIFTPTFRELPGHHNTAGIIEGERHAARNQTGSLMTTYVERSQSEFVVIDIELRGDPYWFTAESDKILYFTFVIGVPDEPSADGKMKQTKEHLITGLYQMLKVTNKFVDGKFTQTLNARRDLLTRIGPSVIAGSNQTPSEFFKENQAATLPGLPGGGG